MESEKESYDDAKADEDIAFLRRTLYDKSKETVFAEKLRATKRRRQEMCKDLNVDIVQQFPYFFVNTDLVSYIIY